MPIYPAASRLVPWLALVGACAGPDAPTYPTDPAAGCLSSVRPTLASCVARDGLTADCGGTSDDTWLACSDAECRLFAGGCVASGYDRVACDLADPCCPGSQITALAGPVESWAFSFHRSFGRALPPLEAAYVLDVVDAAPSGHTGASVTCHASVPATSACPVDTTETGFALSPYFESVTGSRAIARSNGLNLDGWVIDVQPSTGPTPKARVCRFETTDGIPTGCTADLGAAAAPGPLRCATSGTVTWDGNGAGRAEVVVDGTSLTIDF